MARQSKPRISNQRDLRGASPGARSRGMADNQLLAPTLVQYPGLAPELARLPQTKDLVALNDTALSNVLSRFGVTQPWPQQRAATVGYLARVSSIPIGTPQFKAEIDRLLDQSSKSGLLRAVRRSYQDYSLAYTDTSGTLIRICEDDEASCDTCVRLGGEEGTIEYHRSIGLPGDASCEGGGYCRCQLVAT